MGYTKTAVKGITWITLLRGSTRILTFIRLAVLGRILSPAQFGYFGIATLILSLLEILTETGINVFFVQEKKPINEYLDTAWILSIFRGIILSILILIFSPFIAQFFNMPEALPVIMLIAVVPLIRGFINPSIVNYQKELLFHNEFKFRTLLFLIDVVISILTAFATRNAIAFVYGLIASAVVEVILSYYLFPLWPKFRLEMKKAKHIIRKGWWVTATGVSLYIADNSDNIAVGKLINSSALGIYQIAYKISTLPISEITAVVNQVIFPVYSRFSDDKKRLGEAFIKVTSLSSVIAFLLGIFVFNYADPIVNILMGDQWSASVPIIKALAFYGILRSVFGNFPPLFLAVGKQDYAAIATSVRASILLISIIPLVLHFGTLGAAYAMIFSIFLEIPILMFFAIKILK